MIHAPLQCRSTRRRWHSLLDEHSMPPPASCSAGPSENGNLVVSILEGQIREAAVAYRLRDEIISLIDQQKPVNIVLDLANVAFIGSVGFLAFLGVRRHLGGGRIILSNV